MRLSKESIKQYIKEYQPVRVSSLMTDLGILDNSAERLVLDIYLQELHQNLNLLIINPEITTKPSELGYYIDKASILEFSEEK